MGRLTSRIVVSALVALLAAASGARAEETAAPTSALSGTYEIGNASTNDASATLDFKATITNEGAADLTGTIVLRDANAAGKVFGRFGRQTIAAGRSVMVMSNVSVPRAEYDRWSGSGSPSLYLYAEDARGRVSMVRIPLSRITLPTRPD